ncbi:MAG: 1,2-phenylacetyl-CoA epoxidase subunit A, partial [Actinomycetota bacterium]|nr:1,2-phenylacetyl-CoA epoxidase subunit A [Actinomycetota bacterium]
ALPDPDLRWNAETEHWDFGPIDWAEFFGVLKGDGPCNEQRMAHRRGAHTDGAWVREAALAYADKHVARTAAVA